VELGEWAGSDWIVTGGLKAGDRVIIDGVMRIGPGAPVQATDVNGAKPEARPAKS
jgi:membrane fusion protein (multidrug efflux system)